MLYQTAKTADLGINFITAFASQLTTKKIWNAKQVISGRVVSLKIGCTTQDQYEKISTYLSAKKVQASASVVSTLPIPTTPTATKRTRKSKSTTTK